MKKESLQRSRTFLGVYRKLLKTRFIAGLAGLCLLTQPIAVKADDTEDLFNIYGMTLGKPVRSDIQRDIESMEEDLSSMQVQKEINKEYNAMVEEYRKKREKLL